MSDRETLNDIVNTIHSAIVDAGWWEELEIVQSHLPPHLKSVVEKWFLATKIALIHSEVSEMMEGLRKDRLDDHLDGRSGRR